MVVAEQLTLAGTVDLRGVGVHSGAPARIRVSGADADTGIVFKPMRSAGRRAAMRVDWRRVTKTELCTTVCDGEGFTVATIEHLMSALAGLGVDNAVVEIDGPEVPILDGSAALYVDAIDACGLVGLGAARKFVRVLKPVRVERGAAHCALAPNAGGLHLDVAIDFAKGPIGRQRKALGVTPDSYRKKIAKARTFGDVADLKTLLAMGFARGSSLENTIALDGGRVLNPEGLRYPDEFIRHKALDAVGDLALAGLPLEADYTASRPGHAMNCAILAALFADPAAFEIVESSGPSVRAPFERARALAVA